jgi:ribosomal protein L40E
MSEIVNSVFNAVTDFAEGNFRNRIFVAPDIPAKKLENARSKFITRNDPIVALIDDTLFGSAKDGLAISEDYIYAKDLIGDSASVKISSIRSITSQSTKLGLLDIYFDGNLFTTLTSFDNEDRDFVMGMLQIAHAASQKSSAITPITSSQPPGKDTIASLIEPKVGISSSFKQTAPCTECSANLPTGAKFCLECGAKVIPRGICHECETNLPEGAKFCLECGAVAGASASKLAPPEISTKLIGDFQMAINSNYNKCIFLNIASIEDSDFPTPVGIGKNPIIILVSEDEDKFLGLIGEDISKSQEILGDSFADVLDGYIDHIQNEFSKLYKSDIEKPFLFEFILGLYAQDFDDFEYENEDTTFSYYDFSDDVDLEDSLGKYGFLLASMDGECTYTDKSLKIIGDDCASAGDCLDICMNNGNQYIAFLD